MNVIRSIRQLRKNFWFDTRFNKLLSVNRDFWGGSEQHTTDNRYILVDLLVDHPGYLIGNCIIANYLKSHFKAALIGLIQYRHKNQSIQLAQSYGIKKFIFTNRPLDRLKSFSKGNRVFESIRHGSRRDLLSLRIDNLPVGDLVYDTYLKKTGYGTIDDLQPVQKYVRQAVRLYDLYRRLFEELNIVATVQGHIVYNDFGILARTAVECGATVFCRKPSSGPVTVKMCTQLSDVMTYEYRIEPGEFTRLHQCFGDRGIAEGKRYIDNRFYSTSNISDTDAVAAFSASKKKYNRRELLAELKLDDNLPVVGIMSHIFADAPHSHAWMMYDDYFEWLCRTLELIKPFKTVNWLVKEHPSLRYYAPKHTVKDAYDRICRNADHIKIVPEDLNTASLLNIVDVIVTVRGTAGLEFSNFGIPCILTGESPYSGLDFTIEPSDTEKYEALLCRIESIHRLSDDQIRRAHFATFLINSLFRVNCCFVPDMPAVFWKEIDEGRVWEQATKLLQKHSIAEDPLYIALNQQLKTKQMHTHNPVFTK
jgi:hypothetical protein